MYLNRAHGKSFGCMPRRSPDNTLLCGALGKFSTLVDVSDIFHSFLLGGGERGVRGVRGRGGDFLLKVPGGGGGLPGGVGAGRGAGRVFAGNVGGGG